MSARPQVQKYRRNALSDVMGQKLPSVSIEKFGDSFLRDI